LDILKRILDVIEQKDGENTVVIDMKSTTILTDYFVITTANSPNHMVAIRDAVVEEFEKLEQKIIYYDKDKQHEWMIVDAGDIVVHIFTKKAREFYDLESLWKNFENLRSKETVS
jgi:ribosome-associated protein